MGKRILLAALLMLCTGCSYQRLKPVPIRPPKRPPCRGTWVCDSRAGEICYCLTPEQTRRWAQRNGL